MKTSVFAFYFVTVQITAYVTAQSSHIFYITTTARLRKDIHVSDAAEEMKEH